MRCPALLLAAALVATLGCSDSTGGAATADTGTAEGKDAGAPSADAGARPDSGRTDAGAPDGGGDAGADAGTDAGATPDASELSDSGVPADAGVDGGPDAGIGDTGPDAGDDAGIQWTGTFDMAAIRDQTTAQCGFSNQHSALKNGVALDVWNVTYYSWESIGGALHPILIRAYAARPQSAAGPIPGVVQAHGLGGYAEEDHATGLASLLGMFAIAYTGPGGGSIPENTSEGLPSSYNNGYRMFDTIPDLRGSWFWAHAVAAMRALTCLQTRAEVDATRLGMTGFSAGSVATLVSSGADDRIRAAVPLSGTGAWDVATQSPAAWQHKLLAQAGLSIASPEWTALMSGLITPAVMVGGTATKILMADGSTDEFFPLTAYLATYGAIAGDDKRSTIAANFDHGCYKVSGVESAQTIEDRASLRSSGGQRMWFNHWFGTRQDYACLPQPPVASVQAAGAAALVIAAVDDGGTCYDVDEVRAWFSNDDSFVYAGDTLDKGSGVYSKLLPVTLQANTIWFVDVQYKTKSLLFPERFSISSPPQVPAGLVPHIRTMDTCL